MKRVLLFVLILFPPSSALAALVTYNASGSIIEDGKAYPVTGSMTLAQPLRELETGEAVDARRLDRPMQLGFFITRYRLRIGEYVYHGRQGSLYFEGPWRGNQVNAEEWFLKDPSGDLEALRVGEWIFGPNFWFLDGTGNRLSRARVLTNELPPMIILWSHNGIFSTRSSPASHILLRAAR